MKEVKRAGIFLMWLLVIWFAFGLGLAAYQRPKSTFTVSSWLAFYCFGAQLRGFEEAANDSGLAFGLFAVAPILAFIGVRLAAAKRQIKRFIEIALGVVLVIASAGIFNFSLPSNYENFFVVYLAYVLYGTLVFSCFFSENGIVKWVLGTFTSVPYLVVTWGLLGLIPAIATEDLLINPTYIKRVSKTDVCTLYSHTFRGSETGETLYVSHEVLPGLDHFTLIKDILPADYLESSRWLDICRSALL